MGWLPRARITALLFGAGGCFGDGLPLHDREHTLAARVQSQVGLELIDFPLPVQIYTSIIPKNLGHVRVPAYTRIPVCIIHSPERKMGARKTNEEKHVNKVFAGLSREFWGDFVYVFFSPIRNDPKNT